MRTPPAPSSIPPVDRPGTAPIAPAETGNPVPAVVPVQPAGTGPDAHADAAAHASAAAVTLSPSLAGLQPGDHVSGVIEGTGEGGRPLLHTQGGVFAVDSDAPLPPGAAVALRVVAVGATVQASISDIGESHQVPQVPAELALASLPGASDPALPTLASQPLVVGALVEAVMIAAPRPAAAAVPLLAPGDRVDVRIATLTPPPQPQSNPAAGAAIWTATVGEQTTPGQVILQTPQATLALASATPLPLGTKVSVEVSAPTGSQPVAHTQPLVAGVRVPAVVISAAPGAAVPSAKGAGQLAPGTPVLVRITAIEVPAKTAPVAQVAQGMTAPRASITVPTVPNTSPKIAGIVTGHAAGGGLLVRTDQGILKMDTAATLAPGTMVEIEVLGPTSAPQGATPAAAAPAETVAPPPILGGILQQLGQTWPNLAEALAAVQVVSPAIAQSVVAAKVPAPNAQLANTFLMFMAALRGGDIRGWFGDDAAKAMDRAGRKDFLSKLSGDMAELAKLADDTPAGEWRPVPLPLFDGKELQQLWMFTRQQQPGEGSEDDENPATRFVIELELSQLGGLQLDGLVQEKRFDLILRSRGAMPDSIRRDLSQIMGESLGATGFEGSLVFEAGAFPVRPMQEVARRTAGARLGAHGGVEI